jgi:probable addiction module antidote protein
MKKKKKEMFTKWDIVDHLKTEKDINAYMTVVLREYGDDAEFVSKCLGDIARARGMAKIAKKTGLGRESLYKALNGTRTPSLATFLKVTRALGMELRVV